MTEFIEFWYTNHRGVFALRKVQRAGAKIIWLDNPEYGYTPGLFLHAYDTDRQDFRTFSLERFDRQQVHVKQNLIYSVILTL